MEQKTTTHQDLKFDPKDVEENKTMALLSYIGVLVFVPLLAKKDSKFAQAHAKQGLVMLIAMVLLGWIPVVGWGVWGLLAIVNIIAIVNTVQGKYWKIPGAHDLAQKMNI